MSSVRKVQSGKCSGAESSRAGEEEKMYEVHCFRPFTGFVSHILTSLGRASEGSKKQKSISSAGNGSRSHGLNKWSQERNRPQGKEPGFSKLPLVTANTNG